MTVPRNPVVAVAAGAVSSLAEGVLPTAMLLRCGVSGIMPTVRRDRDGEPLLMGYVPTIDGRIEGEQRAALLAERALHECASRLAKSLVVAQVAKDGRAREAIDVRAGLSISFGPSVAGERASNAVAIGASSALAKAFDVPMRGDGAVLGASTKSVRFDVAERAASLDAAEGPIDLLGRALDWLASGKTDVVFWGAAHSDWSTARIAELDARGMLYHLSSLDATLPGEGAAFIAWMTEERARARGLSPLFRLGGYASSGVDESDAVRRMDGLARVAANATEADKEPRAGWVLTDLTFEARRQAEWEAMIARAQKLFAMPYLIDNPCRRIGAVGAAAIPLYGAVMGESFRAGYVPSPSALVLGGNEHGRRAALWLVQ